MLAASVAIAIVGGNIAATFTFIVVATVKRDGWNGFRAFMDS